MKFFGALLVAAYAGIAAADVAFTNTAEDYASIAAGESISLKWSGETGAVTITLKTGDESNLQTVEVLTTTTGESFTWTPKTTYASGTYALEIQDSVSVNYSPQFSLTGTGTASSTGSSSTGSATRTTSSSITSTTSASTTSASSTTSSGSTSSASSNSTTTSRSSTSSRTATTTSSSATSTPENTNNGQRLGSPLAFILVTVATLLYFN